MPKHNPSTRHAKTMADGAAAVPVPCTGNGCRLVAEDGFSSLGRQQVLNEGIVLWCNTRTQHREDVGRVDETMPTAEADPAAAAAAAAAAFALAMPLSMAAVYCGVLCTTYETSANTANSRSLLRRLDMTRRWSHTEEWHAKDHTHDSITTGGFFRHSPSDRSTRLNPCARVVGRLRQKPAHTTDTFESVQQGRGESKRIGFRDREEESCGSQAQHS